MKKIICGFLLCLSFTPMIASAQAFVCSGLSGADAMNCAQANSDLTAGNFDNVENDLGVANNYGAGFTPPWAQAAFVDLCSGTYTGPGDLTQVASHCAALETWGYSLAGPMSGVPSPSTFGGAVNFSNVSQDAVYAGWAVIAIVLLVVGYYVIEPLVLSAALGEDAYLGYLGLRAFYQGSKTVAQIYQDRESRAYARVINGKDSDGSSAEYLQAKRWKRTSR